MGDFLGHFIAGTFLSIFALWLLCSAIFLQARNGGRTTQEFVARVFYNKPRLVTLAFVCSLIGILVD